jgi:hypothetical protein
MANDEEHSRWLTKILSALEELRSDGPDLPASDAIRDASTSSDDVSTCTVIQATAAGPALPALTAGAVCASAAAAPGSLHERSAGAHVASPVDHHARGRHCETRHPP